MPIKNKKEVYSRAAIIIQMSHNPYLCENQRIFACGILECQYIICLIFIQIIFLPQWQSKKVSPASF